MIALLTRYRLDPAGALAGDDLARGRWLPSAPLRTQRDHELSLGRVPPDDLKGLVVLPRRWIVERTFSWSGRNRRLAKEHENLAYTFAAFVTLSTIQFGLRRLARC